MYQARRDSMRANSILALALLALVGGGVGATLYQLTADLVISFLVGTVCFSALTYLLLPRVARASQMQPNVSPPEIYRDVESPEESTQAHADLLASQANEMAQQYDDKPENAIFEVNAEDAPALVELLLQAHHIQAVVDPPHEKTLLRLLGQAYPEQQSPIGQSTKDELTE
jgi:hypothetical protein